MEKSTASSVGKRDYAIFLLLSIYGMRCSEVANLKLRDIDWRNEQIHLNRAKGCKPQTLPLKSGKLIRKQLEVDFVVNQGSQRYCIQSAFAMPTLEKKAQESPSLLRIKVSYKKIIIVKDDIKPKRNEDGILTIELKDFLLDKNSLNY